MTSSAAAANIISSSILNKPLNVNNSNLSDSKDINNQDDEQSKLYYNNIFIPNRKLILNLNSVKEFGESSGNVAIGLVKRFLVYSKGELDNLKNCEGTIINHNLTKLGVYLDEKNIFHCIKPICTHLGCEVKFNEAEKTWDCRCHGSRFDMFGNIIQGPATIPLKYYCIKKEELLNQ
jgi:Rieske Fe-S protein